MGRITPPHDSAWLRFSRLDRGVQAGGLERFIRHLEDRIPALNLESELMAVAMELAYLCPELDEDERMITVLLMLTVMADVERGSTRTDLGDGDRGDGLEIRFGELLEGWNTGETGPQLLAERARELLNSGRLDALVAGSQGEARPLIRHDRWLYQHRMFWAEDRLASGLSARLGRDSSLNAVHSDALKTVLDNPAGFNLSDEQAGAVAQALSQPLTLVSGGPGTGKTSIVVALLRAFVRVGVKPGEIALAAPTGKAAWRMGASIRSGLRQLSSIDDVDQGLIDDCPQPATLHRLLEYSPRQGRFRRHRHDPIDARVVIIDEGSMIDALMMEKLVSALRSDTQLVILGDADQLPSVSAGAVFRDFLGVCPEACATLRHSYRMRADDPNGSAILRLASMVNGGADRDELLSGLVLCTDASELKGLAVEFMVHDQGAPTVFLDHWYDQYVRWGALEAHAIGLWELEDGQLAPADIDIMTACFEHLETARILSLTRSWATGVVQTNAYLHRKTMNHLGLNDGEFACGEPVMMLANDYGRGLFNGDQGLIVRVSEGAGERLAVAFPTLEGVRIYDLDPLRPQLELAYCMTVHKSQGSEFERIAILLPTETLPLLSRELLYTGITRSRSGVMLVGQVTMLSYAVEHPTDRRSGLEDRLSHHRAQMAQEQS